MKLDFDVTFGVNLKVSEAAIRAAIEYEKEYGHDLDDCEFLDLSEDTQKDIVFRWFTNEVGLGSYHRDYSGRNPMICLRDDYKKLIESISFEPPDSEEGYKLLY